MRLLPRQTALLIALSLSSGCATLVSGTHQDVRVRSDPPGAVATLSGGGSVITPGRLSIDRSEPTEVTFTAEGYHSVTIRMEREVNPWVMGNVFCLILPGLVADFLMGGAYRFDKEVFVRLEALPPPPDDDR